MIKPERFRRFNVRLFPYVKYRSSYNSSCFRESNGDHCYNHRFCSRAESSSNPKSEKYSGKGEHDIKDAHYKRIKPSPEKPRYKPYNSARDSGYDRWANCDKKCKSSTMNQSAKYVTSDLVCAQKMTFGKHWQ